MFSDYLSEAFLAVLVGRLREAFVNILADLD